VTNTEKQFKGGMMYFYSEVLVHGHLPYSFWACGEEEHHGRRVWCSRTAHLMLTRKWKERQEGASARYSPKNTTPAI
jgi:hypothetical protein